MKFNSKKILSMIMASTMALSLAVPAFAANAVKDDKGNYSVNIDSEITSPTIEVTVADSGTVVLNPYKLPYEVKPADGDNEAVTSDDQIIFPTQYIEVKSDADVRVSATATAEVGGKMKLATTSTQSGTTAQTANNVFVYMIAETVADKNAEVTKADYDAKKHVMPKTTAAAPMVVGELHKTGLGESDPAAVMGFRLVGDMVGAPTTPWDEKDTLKVGLVFSFTSTTMKTST